MNNVSKLVFANKLIEEYGLRSPYLREGQEGLKQSILKSGFKCAISGIPFKCEGGSAYRPEHVLLLEPMWVSYSLSCVISNIRTGTGNRKPFRYDDNGDYIRYTPQDRIKDKLLSLLEQGLSKEEFILAYEYADNKLDELGFYNQ